MTSNPELIRPACQFPTSHCNSAHVFSVASISRKKHKNQEARDRQSNKITAYHFISCANIQKRSPPTCSPACLLGLHISPTSSSYSGLCHRLLHLSVNSSEDYTLKTFPADVLRVPRGYAAI